MSSENDTICALSTPRGRSAIGLIRLSGPNSISAVDRIFRGRKGRCLAHGASHTSHLGSIVDPESGEVIDEVMIVVFRAPKTYTREDVVEISGHGNPLSLQRIIEALGRLGIRVATPGEFTKRAFLNGRIDLSQAEAVMDLISARTEAARRIAMKQLDGALGEEVRKLRDQITDVLAVLEALIDFPEEDLGPDYRPDCLKHVTACRDRLQRLVEATKQGRKIKEGVKTTIIGRPNAGKSSLFNRLIEQDRAIVSSFPGTTRDTIEALWLAEGIGIVLTDTAGLRSSQDPIELEGIRRTHQAVEEADLLLMVVDAEQGLLDGDTAFLTSRLALGPVILAINKTDKAPDAAEEIRGEIANKLTAVCVSATEGLGLPKLRSEIGAKVLSLVGSGEEEALSCQLRHESALLECLEALERASSGLEQGWSEEVVALDLRGAIRCLDDLVGVAAHDEVLDRIFGRFCIGK